MSVRAGDDAPDIVYTEMLGAWTLDLCESTRPSHSADLLPLRLW
jgi:hypothetical protein